MKFEKGKSGNPGGRPKALLEVIALAKTHTEKAVATLADIMGNDEVDPRARVAAANALLDRAWGKAAQAVHVTAETPQAVAILFPTLPARSE